MFSSIQDGVPVQRIRPFLLTTWHSTSSLDGHQSVSEVGNKDASETYITKKQQMYDILKSYSSGSRQLNTNW